jgi:hypothetical protein
MHGFRGESIAMFECDFIIPSNEPDKARAVADPLSCPTRVFDGTGYPSYAKLWNDCVRSSAMDIVILCGDEARPRDCDVEKMVRLVQSGFGSVQMRGLGFQGFYRDLVNWIGWMDERFPGGGGEYPDFLLRHKEADVAYYESLEVEHDKSEGTGNQGNSYDFFHRKWISPRYEGEIAFDQRILEEIDRAGVDCVPRKFLSFSDTVVLTGNDSLLQRRMARRPSPLHRRFVLPHI